jgi:hypothetical protein
VLDLVLARPDGVEEQLTAAIKVMTITAVAHGHCHSQLMPGLGNRQLLRFIPIPMSFQNPQLKLG